MTPSEVIKQAVPRGPNGRVEWLQYLRLWPVALALIAFAFYLGGRLETPTEKLLRIRDITDPMQVKIAKIEAMQAGRSVAGAVLEARVTSIEARLKDMDGKLDALLDRIPKQESH